MNAMNLVAAIFGGAGIYLIITSLTGTVVPWVGGRSLQGAAKKVSQPSLQARIEALDVVIPSDDRQVGSRVLDPNLRLEVESGVAELHPGKALARRVRDEHVLAALCDAPECRAASRRVVQAPLLMQRAV